MMHDMLHYYQPHLHHFLGRKKHTLPNNVSRAYYWSFEDALWDVLPTLGIAKGSTLLLPDFYCIDVVQNLNSHGYNVEYYPLDASFQISESLFTKYVQKSQPSAVVIFHACGIRSTILQTSFLRMLMNKGTVVIEDAVHNLIDMSAVVIQHHNHIIIDSLRKVSPLPGSFVYGKPEVIDRLQLHPMLFSWYSVQSGLYYFLFWIGMKFASILSFTKLAHYLHDHVLKKHDNIIGVELRSHKGLPIIQHIHRYIDVQRIQHVKQYQVALYMQTFHSLHIPQQNLSRTQELHVFPYITSPLIAEKLHPLLAKKNIYLTQKFMDSPWGKRHAVLFLPIGPHISNNEIVSLCHVIAICLRIISFDPSDPVATPSRPHTRQAQ